MKKLILTPLVLILFLPQLLMASTSSLPDFAELVEDQGKAVVNISTKQNLKAGIPGHGDMQIPGIPEDSPFHDFFEKFFEQMPQVPDQHPSIKSLGSGFIISEDGYVLTSAHVVEDADEVIVRMTDRSEMVARVIGMDKRSDVALLKVDAKGLPYLKPGKPGELRVGEWVLAIGSPFGFENTATAGIVSAKGRSLPNENYIPFIQSDVAINPGNSGGPLFNMKGEVVGINAQIYSRSGGYMGLAFSVPIDLAMQVADQLRTNGSVKRGWLGVTIQNVNRELAEALGMEKPSGALVSSIMPDSPASKSNIQVQDVIVKFNGKPIQRSSDLPFLVGRTPVGTVASLTVIRAGKKRELEVTIGQLPDAEIAQAGEAETAAKKSESGKLGLNVRTLSDDEKAMLDLEHGVVVEEVLPGSPASQAGIMKGDVGVLLNGKKVKSAQAYNKLAGALAKGKPAAVLVRRGKGSQFLVIKP
jgi:serine protease Do